MFIHFMLFLFSITKKDIVANAGPVAVARLFMQKRLTSIEEKGPISIEIDPLRNDLYIEKEDRSYIYSTQCIKLPPISSYLICHVILCAKLPFIFPLSSMFIITMYSYKLIYHTYKYLKTFLLKLRIICS